MNTSIPDASHIKSYLDQATLQKKISELAERITQDYQGQEVVMIGLMKGAIFIFADLVRKIPLKLELDFIYATSYKGKKSTGNVEILLDSKVDIFDRHVLVVDDIVDTGITIDKIQKLLSTRQPKSLEFCVLFDKREKRLVEVDVKYIGFEVPDHFYIGFGLDLDGWFRELPFLGVI